MTAVENLSWDEVGRRAASGAFAILPVGAGAKEHGLHLTMATDRIQADYLAARLAERCDALVWPTLAYGYYPAFVDYAGSASLSVATFEAVIEELATALLGYCPRGVAILDTGISTIPPIDRVIAGLSGRERILHLKVHEGPRYRDAAARLATQSHGGHADQLETARMLALAPELVAMDRVGVGTTRSLVLGPLQKHDPEAANYSPAGSTGDPSAATLVVGEALLVAMADDLVAAVTAWL